MVVSGLKLPPGYNRSTTDLLIEIPDSYPVTPPGVADHVYINPHLRFHGRELEDLHPYRTPNFDTPGFGPWAWLCYLEIDWWPERDDLIKFVEMVRADLSQPKTRSRYSFL